MTVEQAIHQFWSIFGLTAYEENAVPTGDDVPKFPYITYSVATAGFGEETQLTASVWTRSTSWVSANNMAESIFNYIGLGGKILKFTDGKIWIKRGTPFSQSMGDPSDSLIKRKYINVTAEFFSAK